ncbi:MAG: leucine-rich repeat protein, partial [Clostridia bacterium]|nr:leucine-rich repeat protein [Clostridia bacterium]
PSRPARADEEIKQAVEMELEEKDETETGYIPDSDSEKKGGAIGEEETKGIAEKEKPASKLATVKGIPDESKLLPYYHILGKYQGYDIEIRAAETVDSPLVYEYSDVFDYFFRRGILTWSSVLPSSCSVHRYASFDCRDCGCAVFFELSGKHTLSDESEVVEGYEVKHCSVCDEDICVDFYKHESVPDDDYVSLDIYIPNENTTVTLRNLTGVTAIRWWAGWQEIAPTKTGNDVEYSFKYEIKGRYYILIRGCTGIGDSAFANVVEVREINVSDDVESVGHNAFAGCSNLDRICFSGATPPEIESDTFSGCSAGIYVSDADVNTYKTAWSSYSDRIQGLSEQEFNPPTNNGSSGSSSGTGAGGGSAESFLSSIGFGDLSLGGLVSDNKTFGKVIAGVMFCGLVVVLFMIFSGKKKRK